MTGLLVGLATLILLGGGSPQTDARCATDLQMRIDATPDGGTLDVTGECFISEQTILFRDRADLTLIGGELTATTDGSGEEPWTGKAAHWPRNRHHVAIIRSRNITVIGLKIKSVNSEGAYVAPLEAQHGFLVTDGSTGTRIENVEVDDVYGDCVAVAEAVSTLVKGADCDDIGRQGVSITDAVDTHIESSTLRHVARSVFDLEPIGRIGQRVENTWIENNTIHGPYGNTTFGMSGSGDIINTYIRHNRMVGVHLRTKLGASDETHESGAVRSGISFIGNVVDTVSLGTATPLAIQNATKVEVVGNTVPVRSDGIPWLSSRNVEDLDVRENSSNGTHLVGGDAGGKKGKKGKKGG